MKYIIIDPVSGEDKNFNNAIIADFLFNNLDQYGDKREFILKAIEYALDPKKGGLILLCIEDDNIIGAVIINNTGMDGYIPSNILVYIAINKEYRGKGIGKKMIQEVITKTKGGIALHVEPDNPAVYLYKKLGFTNKYLEMRFLHDEK